MKKFLKHYENPNEINFNFDLINRCADGDIIPYILDVCKSLEDLEYITFLEDEWEYEDDESKIDINEYIRTRNNSKSKKVVDTKYMLLNDTRYAQMTLRFRVDFKGETEYITKKLQIPVPDENGYYILRGKKYVLYWQIVDASTYVKQQDVTLKSFIGLSLLRSECTFEDVNGEPYSAPIYNIQAFKKNVNVFSYYFSTMGVTNTLRYFSVDRVIKLVLDYDPNDDEHLYFPISKKLFIQVNKKLFKDSIYVRSMTFMLKELTTNRLTIEDIDNKDFWIEKLGSKSATNSKNYYSKGKTSLTYFNKLIDNGTKKILRVHHSNRDNVYSVIRWLIQNYNEHRKKNPYSLDNRRLRCNECIASLLTKTFNDKITRVVRYGDKLDMDKVLEIFKWNGDVLIGSLQQSNLLRFDENVSDMDFWSKLKVTAKGPNAMGVKNSNTIKSERRGIDPSMIGVFDINVCGTSDPGTTMLLTPAAKTYGLYFTDKTEPESFRYEFEKSISSEFDKDDARVDIENMTETEFYDCMDTMENILTNIQVTRSKKKDKGE